MTRSNYYSLDGEHLRFDKQRSSAFAKQVAGDFNPIHNPDAKRFCVPGDLLFTAFLHHYGVYQSMQFEFSGMVGEDTALVLPDITDNTVSLCDAQGKNYMDVSVAGSSTQQATFIDKLALRYVQFSGRTFPDILVELMHRGNVMINPERPLVIYKSMYIALDSFLGDAISLELVDAHMQVDGKKGDALLQFSINADGVPIGRGEKRMLLSGLRPYQQARIDTIVSAYAEWKSSYRAS